MNGNNNLRIGPYFQAKPNDERGQLKKFKKKVNLANRNKFIPI